MEEFDIEIEGIEQLKEQFEDMGRRVRVEVARGLNDAAFVLARRMSADIASKIDNPKPFSQRSMIVTKKASEDELVAELDMRPIQARYLRPLFTGGQRGLKNVEQRFMGRAFVPGGGVKLDRYGNIPKATQLRIVQALSRDREGPARYGSYVIFVGRPHARMPEGVWMRRARRLVALLIFKDQPPTYRKSIDFEALATDAVQQVVGPAVQAALARALRSE